MRFVTLALSRFCRWRATAQDIDKVNGNASIGPGQHAGDIHSVNGSVDVGNGASCRTPAR